MAAHVPVQLDPRMVRLRNHYGRLIAERYSEFMSQRPHLDPDDPDWSPEDRAACDAYDEEIRAEGRAACIELAQKILAERDQPAAQTT